MQPVATQTATLSGSRECVFVCAPLFAMRRDEVVFVGQPFQTDKYWDYSGVCTRAHAKRSQARSRRHTMHRTMCGGSDDDDAGDPAHAHTLCAGSGNGDAQYAFRWSRGKYIMDGVCSDASTMHRIITLCEHDAAVRSALGKRMRHAIICD